jgi:DNA-directed RNA polymerase specialized sigma subunit
MTSRNPLSVAITPRSVSREVCRRFGLTRRQYRVLVLYYGHEYTQDEIGLSLGIARKHVYALLSKACRSA